MSINEANTKAKVAAPLVEQASALHWQTDQTIAGYKIPFFAQNGKLEMIFSGQEKSNI
jgi:hypothetical protein